MTTTDPAIPSSPRGHREEEPTFPRLQSLVHKHAAEEVLLAWASLRSDGAWGFGVDLHRDHSSNSHARGVVPLISGLEIVRQLGLATGHLRAEVPIDWAFTLQQATFRWLSGPVGFDPVGHFRPTATVEVENILRRKGQVSGLIARTELSLDGEVIALGSGELRCFDPETYTRFRRRLARPSASREATTADLRDVSIGPSELDARLGWPSHDTFLFDHTTDHIPGISFRSAASAR